MDIPVMETAGQSAGFVSFDQAMAARDRLSLSLRSMLDMGTARPAIDDTLPRDLRITAMALTDDEIAMSAEALIGVAMQGSMLQPSDTPSRPPFPSYRILGALLSGLSAPRAIHAATRALASVSKLLSGAGGAGDRIEHVLAGLLGSLDNAPAALYEWLCDRLLELPQDGETARLSASAIPWLVNRIPAMPQGVTRRVFEAALARCKTLSEVDRVPMWLAFAAPSTAAAKRNLLEPVGEDGARVVPGVLIEDENLPVPPSVRNLERQLNLLLAANIRASREDTDKRAALREVSAHLSAADLELAAELLANKAPFMLGALFCERSQQEATLMARYLGGAGEASILRAVVEGLGDALVEVYEPFVRQLAVTPDDAAEPGAKLRLAKDTPDAAKALIAQVLPAFAA